MISFAQHLFEAEFKRLTNGGHYVHQATVDGHNLQVQMARRGEDSYEAMVTVDNTVNKGRVVGDQTKSRIAQHAGKAVDHFIRHIKPKTVRFSAADADDSSVERKDVAYGKMSSMLAKRHGGTHQVVGQTHVLSFDH